MIGMDIDNEFIFSIVQALFEITALNTDALLFRGWKKYANIYLLKNGIADVTYEEIHKEKYTYGQITIVQSIHTKPHRLIPFDFHRFWHEFWKRDSRLFRAKLVAIGDYNDFFKRKGWENEKNIWYKPDRTISCEYNPYTNLSAVTDVLPGNSSEYIKRLQAEICND